MSDRSVRKVLAQWGDWVDQAGPELLRRRGFTLRPVAPSASPVDVVPECTALYVRAPSVASRDVIEHLPKLRVIAVPGAGVEIVDVPAATERGIPVLHGKGLGAAAVAEWVIGAMVWLVRDVAALQADLLAGRWTVRARTEGRRDLGALTVGVLGYGAIGRRVAQMVRDCFGSTVLVTDPHPAARDAATAEGHAVHDLDAVLAASQVVTVHAAATPSAPPLLDRRRIDLIGPDGYLINTSRGQLVDAAAVAAALAEGRLGGAALDVFDPEPVDPDLARRLAGHPRVLLSPHASGMTEDATRALALGVAASLHEVFSGGRPANCANPEVWDRPRWAGGRAPTSTPGGQG